MFALLHHPRTCLGIRGLGALFMFSCAFGVVKVLCLFCLVVCTCLMAYSLVVVIGVVGVVVMHVMIVLVGGIVVVLFVLGASVVLGAVFFNCLRSCSCVVEVIVNRVRVVALPSNLFGHSESWCFA